MATVNLGRIKPVFRGAYNNSTAYVVDDIVTSGNETFIAIAATQGNATSDGSKWTKLAAKGADGTDVAATLANKEISFKTNAGALDGIPIGTAGQFLKVNSGATGYEFATADSGKTLGITQFSNNTRASLSNSTNALLWNGSYTQIKAGSKLLLTFALSGWSGSGGAGNWRFVYDGTDHNHALKYNYYPSYMITTFGHFLIDGASSTGSKNWEIRYYSAGSADSPFSIWNPSSSDDGRINNSANMSNFIIQELDF